MLNPFRRRWVLRRHRISTAAGYWKLYPATPLDPDRRYWTLKAAERAAVHLNGGLASIQSRFRYRVVRLP